MSPKAALSPKVLTVTRTFGLGLFVNPSRYRYVAFQLGPLWFYLYHEKWHS